MKHDDLVNDGTGKMVSASYKKLCVLQQGGHRENDCTSSQKSALDGFHFYRLNWSGDFEDARASIILFEKSMFTEGRQYLYERIRDSVDTEYYMFIDDDISFDGVGYGRKIFDYLEEWKPLCASVSCLVTRRNRMSWDERGVEYKACPSRYLAHDECLQIFHKSVVDKFFPFPLHSKGSILRLIELAVARLYPGKMARFNDIVVSNSGHRERGAGHGSMGEERYNKAVHVLQPAFKFVLKSGAEEKAYICNKNKHLACIEPDKKKEVFSNDDLGSVVDTEASIWKQRESLLGKFNGFSKSGVG